MTLKFIPKDLQFFKKLMDGIFNLPITSSGKRQKKKYENIPFNFSKEGIEIIMMDSSRIRLFKIVIPKEIFEEYTYTYGNPTLLIELDPNKFVKILERARAGKQYNEEISFTYNPEDVLTKHNQSIHLDKFDIKITGEKRSKDLNRIFYLPIERDIDRDVVPMDNLDKIQYAEKGATFEIRSHFLTDIINDIKAIGSDIVQFVIPVKGNVKFYGGTKKKDAVDRIAGEWSLRKIHLMNFVMGSKEDVTGAYSIPFYENLKKFFPITDRIKLHLRSDHPLRTELHLLNNVIVKDYIAPRVEEIDFEDDDMDEF
jgi:hypothetical protein